MGTYTLRLLLLASCPHLAQASEGLTLRDAIAVALKSQPRLQAAHADVDAAEARVGRAFASYLPSLSLGGFGRYDYSNYNLVVVGTPSNPSAVTNLTAPFASSFRYSAALSAQQTVLDVGRTSSRVAGAREDVASLREDRDAVRAAVELRVAAAYLGVLQANALKAVSDESVAFSTTNAHRAETLFKAGIKPELDVLAAQTELARARLGAVHAVSAIDAARAELSDAMGIDAVDAALFDDPIGALKEEDEPSDALVARAMRDRPEVKSARHAVAAARARVRVSRADYFPLLTLGAAIAGTGTDAALGPYFDASVSATLVQPLFDGLATHRAVQEAEAHLRSLESQEQVAERQVRLAVRNALIALAEGKKSLAAASVMSGIAERQLQMAGARYQSGVASLLDVLNANAALVDARAQVVRARYGAALDRAVVLQTIGSDLGVAVGGMK